MIITKIGDLPVRRIQDSQVKFNFLVYGSSGSGKTRLAGSAYEVPELNPLLFLDIEGGGLTLKSTFPEIETVRIDTWAGLQKVYEELKLGKHPYRTVCLDSITEMQKIGMDHTMFERHGDDDLAVPEIKEWNINIEQVRRYVRRFRDLEKVNVIFTALERIDTDKRTQLSRSKPSLSGKVADEVSGFLDIVTHLRVEEVEGVNTRILLTGNTAGKVAKDRTNLLPFQLANPTMKLIYNHINGKVTDDVQVEHVG